MKVNAAISQRVTRLGGTPTLTRVVRILIESGLIYTVSTAVFFCTYLAANDSQYAVADVVSFIHVSTAVCSTMSLLT